MDPKDLKNAICIIQYNISVERENDSKKRLFDLTITLKSGPVTTRRYRKNKYKFRPRSVSENCVIMIFF
jgi:hypothetical protein